MLASSLRTYTRSFRLHFIRFQSLLADTDSGNFIINTYKSGSSDIYSQFTFTGEKFVTTSYNTFNRNNYNVKLCMRVIRPYE